MLLATLLDRVRSERTACRVVRGPVDRDVGAVVERDDALSAGGVFVAVRGQRVDGHERVAGLGHAGCLVVDREILAPVGPAIVQVPDTRAALAHFAAARLDWPGRSMPVIGITGTNGKTSTTWIVAAIAQAAGWKAGLIGTTGHRIGDEAVAATHTTPGAVEIQALLARMRDAQCRVVAMEASSIGLAAFRADAIPFAAAVFTNLTRDHLDWHGTMAAYASAKARLFHELVKGVSVLNAADPASKAMAPPRGATWWFNGPDLRVSDVRLSASGTTARFHTPEGDFDGHLRLVGAHNLDNALAAIGAALAVGLPLDACAAGLSALVAVPGRLEPVPNDRGITVFVDYAHTDDALARVLASLRSVSTGRILTVFGCGGDRDRGKRPLMGAAAATGSDLVVVTSDNPRSEDAGAIIADILPGIGERPHRIEPDRRAAIALALAAAEPGDIVLIAGKGHEATQTVGDFSMPFDDRRVATELLA